MYQLEENISIAGFCSLVIVNTVVVYIDANPINSIH
jgi:hypothetical protein